MNIFKYIIYFFCLSCPFAAASQDIEWQKTLGGDDADEFRDIIQTNDGGYIMVGFSGSFPSGDKTVKPFGYDQVDTWVVKLDAAKNIQWQKTIGGTNNDIPANIIQTGDGGYILGVSSGSNSYSGGISGNRTVAAKGYNDYWLIKLDLAGNILWQKAYGGGEGSRSRMLSLIPTSDGGFFMAGTSTGSMGNDRTASSRGGADFWLVRTDVAGNVLWQRLLGSDGDDAMNYGGNPVCTETSDGGFMIGGYSDGGISGDKTEASQGEYDYWVIKLNGSGATEWQKRYGGTGSDLLTMLLQTRDGGYLLGGFSNSEISGDKKEQPRGVYDYYYKNDFWVLKLDAAGSIQWEKTLGGDEDDFLQTAVQTPDGGFLLGGASSSSVSGEKTGQSRGGNDYWLVRLDATGNLLWDKTFGGDGFDYLKILRPTTDGGYILGGISGSGISGEKNESYRGPYSSFDYWLVKIGRCKGADPLVDADGLTLHSSGSFYAYQWILNGQPIAGANAVSFTATQSGLYSLAIIDNKGCLDTSGLRQVTVETNLFVPNVFSPNGDSKNDIFKVYGNHLAKVRMQVFNQWGQLIFGTQEVQVGWDGMSGGKQQPSGTYIYVLEATLSDGSVIKKKGSVSLVR